MPGKTSRRKRRQQGSNGSPQTRKTHPSQPSTRQNMHPTATPSSLDSPTADPIRVSKQPTITTKKSSNDAPQGTSSIAPSTARAISFLQQRRQEILRELRNLSMVWAVIILIFGAVLTTLSFT